MSHVKRTSLLAPTALACMLIAGPAVLAADPIPVAQDEIAPQNSGYDYAPRWIGDHLVYRSTMGNPTGAGLIYLPFTSGAWEFFPDPQGPTQIENVSSFRGVVMYTIPETTGQSGALFSALHAGIATMGIAPPPGISNPVLFPSSANPIFNDTAIWADPGSPLDPMFAWMQVGQRGTWDLHVSSAGLLYLGASTPTSVFSGDNGFNEFDPALQGMMSAGPPTHLWVAFARDTTERRPELVVAQMDGLGTSVTGEEVIDRGRRPVLVDIGSGDMSLIYEAHYVDGSRISTEIREAVGPDPSSLASTVQTLVGRSNGPTECLHFSHPRVGFNGRFVGFVGSGCAEPYGGVTIRRKLFLLDRHCQKIMEVAPLPHTQLILDGEEFDLHATAPQLAFVATDYNAYGMDQFVRVAEIDTSKCH